jgi:hypothetical protein
VAIAIVLRMSDLGRPAWMKKEHAAFAALQDGMLCCLLITSRKQPSDRANDNN